MAKTKSKRRKLNKGLGWLPDVPDARDHVARFRFVRPVEEVDLRSAGPEIEDQGQLGSCTANAICSALEFLEIKHQDPVVNQSRLFVYYNERVYIDTVNEDSGAIIRDGIKSLNKRGVCPEDMWPYDIERFTEKPDIAAFREARKHKTVSYQRINNFNQMKACLGEGYPFIFGFAVYDSFWDANSGGVVPMPDLQNESMIGGHAVIAIGYRDSKQQFICQNSWGKNWGDNGYFYMPYEYLKDRNLSDDFWVIRY